jgi:glycosyltransferase involved in cell wall biosynthesis
MNFIEICYGYPSERPPPEFYFSLPLEVASEMGLKAEVYTLRNVRQTRKKEFVGGFRVSRFNNSFQLLMDLAKKRADLTHGNTLGFIAATLAPLIKRPYVLTAHTNKAKPRNIKYRLALWFAAKSDKILVSTNFTKKSFTSLVKEEKMEVLPCPIDYKFWNAKISGNGFRSNMGIDKELIISVGNIRKIKNFETAIRSLKLVKKSFPKTKLCIVGAPVDSRYVRRLRLLIKKLDLQKDVIFTGLLNREKLREAFNAADVFVFPSVYEVQGIVAYEAAVVGLPMVLSNLGVFTDVFSNVALFHEPWDHVMLAEQIKSVLINPNLSKSLGHGGQQRMKNYDINAIKPQLRRLYEELLVKK